MTKDKHTAGPWETHHRPRVSYIAAKTKIADVYSEAFDDIENQKANARLIAAAPELLDIADRMQLALFACQFVIRDAEARAMVGEIIAEAKAVIAKARGETSSTEAA